MSLIYCPECGHEISSAAVACPSCGRPVSARPVVEKKVVVADLPRENDGFPKWAFIPLGLIGAVLLLVFFVMMSRDSDDANSNLSVNVSTRRPVNSGTVSATESQTLSVPPSTSAQTVTVPSGSSMPSTSVTVPGTSVSDTGVRSEKGTVTIDAKVATQTGAPRAVRNERFYLLDKDIETILSDADIEPIEGQTLTNSFGLSVLYPSRYGDFNRQALRAIKEHIKYSGQTDGSGRAQLGGVEPDSYYLFGITKTGEGFALWNSPVTVISGVNNLNLSPQPITRMSNG